MSIEYQIKEALEGIARLRVELDAAKDAVEKAQDAVVATPEGHNLTLAEIAMMNARLALEDKESETRQLILLAYAKTGNKKPAEGAGVRVTKRTYRIADMGAAVEWAEKNAPVAVIKTVNEKVIIPIVEMDAARNGEIMEWAELVPEKPTATISQDLSGYLRQEGKNGRE